MTRYLRRVVLELVARTAGTLVAYTVLVRYLRRLH